MKENLLVIFGGVSCEHDISIISAMQAIKNIDENLYNIIPIYITKSGKLKTGSKLKKLTTFSNFNENKFRDVCFVCGQNNLFIKNAFGYHKKTKIDVALVIMHGENGEDGKIASLLSLCNIPYSAADQIASGVCMDKCVFKNYLKGLRIKTVKSVNLNFFDYSKNPEKIREHVVKKLNFPLIIKPATLGSSIGIKIAKNALELEDGLAVAFSYCKKVLIEQFLENITEINLAIEGVENNLTISIPEQPVKQNDILTFDNKYLAGASAGMENLKRIIPAPISPKQKKIITNMALKIFNSLNLKGVVRFDFIIDNNLDKIYVNEVNTIPGSLAFYLFSPMNVSYKNLINKLIKNAYSSFDSTQNLIKTFNSSVLSKTNIAGGVKK